jgi:hypothetical protein
MLVHGRLKVAKRYLLQVAARNLGRIMRHLFGMGTPKGLQKEGDTTLFVYLHSTALWRVLQLDRRPLPSLFAVRTKTSPRFITL